MILKYIKEYDNTYIQIYTAHIKEGQPPRIGELCFKWYILVIN